MPSATVQSPGGCQCVTGECLVHFDVRGCWELPLNAAVVDVYADGTKSTLVATGVTDSTGTASLSLPGPGSYFYSVSAYGFASPAESLETFACGEGQLVFLDFFDLDPGRHPLPGNATPYPETLHVSFVIGSLSVSTPLYWGPSGGGWGDFGIAAGTTCGGASTLAISVDAYPVEEGGGSPFSVEWQVEEFIWMPFQVQGVGVMPATSISGPGPVTVWTGGSDSEAPSPANCCRPSTACTFTITE